MQETLLLAAIVSFLAAGVLALSGSVVWMRRGSLRGIRTAGAMFALWWYAFAASNALAGVTDLLALLGGVPLTLFVGLQFLNVVVICMGLAGLLCYMLFLYTGSAVWFWPLTLGYAVYAGILVRVVIAWEPAGLLVSPWETNLIYLRPGSGVTQVLMLFVLIGPQLLAALGLFALAPRLPRSASRVRLLVVASAIFLWFGSVFLANVAGVSSHPAWEAVAMFIPLFVGVAVLLVHRPPAWLRRRMPPELPDPNALRGGSERLARRV